ncbi:NAD-dependent epimerase/dehydratase family protein [Ktedonospora formicarum]|uniref:Oxidoreductase n=1 Tax=Ktedonospora formicarum TaxID=2778364 RepID=A0A8J3MUJ0_9CHLR|nr:NAD(P)-dependent oxidoreductase [Ktedonospora formicarum]GHO48265.1 oxidoreductase [Ktedonospora formicarum]
MRVLLTGSSGQLGSAIAEALTARGHEVYGIDRRAGPWTRELVNIGERETLFSLARWSNVVIHTASLHQPDMARYSESDFVETNVNGTLNLLEAAQAAGVGRFVYTSTTSVYGKAMRSWRGAVWVTEELHPRPRDIYDRTKLSAEALCKHFALKRGLPAICLRVARFFQESPREMALHRLYRGLDVRDGAMAHVLAALNESQTFDILTIAARSPFKREDTSLLLRDPVAVLRQRLPEVLDVFAARGWELPKSIDRVYDSERAESVLGFQPAHNFLEHVHA